MKKRIWPLAEQSFVTQCRSGHIDWHLPLQDDAARMGGTWQSVNADMGHYD
jgi:hypothetical protein